MTQKEMNLKDYVEGRFNRLERDIDSKLKCQQEEFLAIIAANDLRYQQRFDAQSKALDFAAVAAKEAVNASLANTDKAAVKTEQAADKRFADLGELIQEQFKGLTDKLDAIIHRVEVVEGRLNMSSGAVTGKRELKEDSRGLWAIFIAVCAVLLTLWMALKG